MAASSPPKTPISSLSKELEAAFAADGDQKMLMTAKSRRKLASSLRDLDEDLNGADRMRTRAVKELLASEKSYLNHLQIVEKFFMEPLLEDASLGVSGSDFAAVFGDLPAIIQVNKELLESLEKSSDRIGRVFLELAPYLKFYSTYAQDFEAAARTVETLAANNKAFRNFMTAQETRPEVQLKLNALLITPVQRIPRYKLLLEDVVKNTPERHEDAANLKDALEQIEAVAWHINEQLREHEAA